ncbi:MAG TPA: 2-dehydropantoate 2-reductase, partial [Alphaproteobacteria bacterium]|nr:2-dehydropantoate 2-reductase [Alphaproteobacteria bacterium]
MIPPKTTSEPSADGRHQSLSCRRARNLRRTSHRLAIGPRDVHRATRSGLLTPLPEERRALLRIQRVAREPERERNPSCPGSRTPGRDARDRLRRRRCARRHRVTDPPCAASAPPCVGALRRRRLEPAGGPTTLLRDVERARAMRTVVVGAGGVGLGLGSCLHASGAALHYVVRRGPAPHPLETHGIERSGLFGDARVPPGVVRVSRGLASLADTAPDYVIVCTKTTSIAEVATGLGEVWHGLGSEPVVVLCQNGWGNAERLAGHLPRDRIFNARVITGFTRDSATAVRVTAHAAPVHIGSLFGEPVERVAPLARAIDAGGIPCATTDAIEADLLAKLLYNCLLNPLGALLGVRYGELAAPKETRRIMEAVAREIFAVLDRAGRRTHWPHADAYLDVFYRELLPPTAEHESSMLQDLTAGRVTEIDALCGAVVRMGAAHDVPTPVNAALGRLVHAAEAR